MGHGDFATPICRVPSTIHGGVDLSIDKIEEASYTKILVFRLYIVPIQT